MRSSTDGKDRSGVYITLLRVYQLQQPQRVSVSEFVENSELERPKVQKIKKTSRIRAFVITCNMRERINCWYYNLARAEIHTAIERFLAANETSRSNPIRYTYRGSKTCPKTAPGRYLNPIQNEKFIIYRFQYYVKHVFLHDGNLNESKNLH